MTHPRARLSQFLRGRLTVGDVIVHLSVPTVLILVYLSSIPHESLLFRPGVSGWTDAYLSILGHASLGHLLGNVFGSFVLSSLSLLLLSDVSRRRFYYASFASILVLVPLLAALQWVLVLELTGPGAFGQHAGVGFSVVTAAFAGLLATALSVHQRETLTGALPPVVSSAGLLALALAVVTVASSGSHWVALGFGAIALGYAGVVGRAARATLRDSHGEVAVSLSVIGLCVYLGAVVDLFVTRGGAVRPHAVGLVLGFAVVWLVFGVEWLVGRRTETRVTGDRERSP